MRNTRRNDRIGTPFGNVLLCVHPVDPGLDHGVLAHDVVRMLLPFVRTVEKIRCVHFHVVGCQLSYPNITSEANEGVQRTAVGVYGLQIEAAYIAVEDEHISGPG